MGELLQVDLDNLRRLGATLAGHAEAIGGLKLTVAVEMPGSPVAAVSAQAGDAVLEGFGVVGIAIRRMADASTNAAGTYEAFDQGFVAQQRRYVSGR